MTRHQPRKRHPLDHPVATLWTLAIGAGGQLLFTWALAKAAEYAERDDLHPGGAVVRAPTPRQVPEGRWSHTG